jgi:glycosidase
LPGGVKGATLTAIAPSSSSLLWLGLATALALPLSCHREPSPAVSAAPRRSCTQSIWVQAAARSLVAIPGSWNKWVLPAQQASEPFDAPGWQRLDLTLPPGDYGYLVQIDGLGGLDPRNALTTFHDSDEVSLLHVDDCTQPSLQIDSAQGSDTGTLTVKATFTASQDGGLLDPSRLTAHITQGDPLTITSADPATGLITAEARGFARGRYTVTLGAADTDGHAVEARAGAWVQPAARSWEGGLLYQIVIDRFRGDEDAVLAPPPAPASRAGGTLGGVLAEIERGAFEALGVTALWLSPVYRNPVEARVGRDGHMSDGYHGYWPLASREVDPRLGGEEALRAVIASAHARGIRVLLDVVPNHVYEENPIYLAHTGQGWFNETNPCVCGFEGCDWGTHIDSCWFAPYLPDIRWQSADATRQQVGDVRWWSDTFEVDGIRIDAVPMMPRAATRRVARDLRDSQAADERPFVLGEVFTGPGQDGIDQTRYFLGPDGLDSAFDFPTMWAIRDAVGTGNAGFDALDAILDATDKSFAGSGTVKARILGNHDTSRFLSVAAGNDAQDPWSAPPPQPTDTVVYARHRAALALLLTLPGLPVLYYGDEVALAGASDPDSRRVLPDFDKLTTEGFATLDWTRRLGRLRSCSKSLKSGDRHAFLATATTYGFTRDAGDGFPVHVLISRSPTATTLTPPAGTWVDAITHQPIPTGPVAIDATGTRVLVAAGDPCVH